MPRFVIHEHHARKLHYDFRLEMDGVLKSWAVPKVPAKRAGLRRLAIQVEDHDLSYIDFEGKIAEGAYGAGEVTIWDSGTYDTESRKDNKIVLHLHGKKLDGRYTLLKMGWGEKQWILFKTKKFNKPLTKSFVQYPKNFITELSLITIIALVLFSPLEARGEGMKEINLPKPKPRGIVSVEEAIQKRRSVRSYAAKDVSLDDISQLLWSCQGITDEKRGLRAAPSAGALYPLEVYLANKDGLFHYVPKGNKLEPLIEKDIRKDLAAASYGQSFVKEAAIDIIICAVYERVTSRYGERGIRYTDMEAGHAAQNVFLQAVALGLDSVAVGAFADDEVSKVLNLPRDVKPLYILPVGYKR